MTKAEDYLARMRRCAAALGRDLAPISPRHREHRLVEQDAELAERGFDIGLLEIFAANRVRTGDPFQATAWLVEGDPARLCWEYLPHLAAYVELIDRRGYPVAAVRFETPDSELRLDLAVLAESGQVLVLGEAKAQADQLVGLEQWVQRYTGDPGFPSRQDPQREAQKLAHQLWATQAPHLWLVASGARRVFDVSYLDRIVLTRRRRLPSAEQLWSDGFHPEQPPRIAVSRS